MSSSKVSVIICTKDRPEDVIRCIKSISIQTLLPDEILVVDSSNTDTLAKDLALQFPDEIKRVKYIHTKPNLSHQRNIGIDASIGDIIVFSDDDVELDKDCLNEIKHVFINDVEGRIGGVTGENIRKENSIIVRVLSPISQAFAAIFLLLKYGNGRLRVSGLPTIIRSGTVDKDIEIDYVIGANMAFRREVITQVRFDEDLPYYDDDDIGYRVSRRYKIIYAPKAKYIHNIASLGGQRRGLVRIIRDIKGYRHYFKKNLPQTLKYKIAFHWALLGLSIRGIIVTFISIVFRVH